ncbi:DNA gyrase/topoisomerase IV subunit A [Opitutus terrae]|uniref:DNA topoisomerase (ATP-hydrolyzing) n=1 Tax=Opitutus terrae (strain DSM 11246 / JCM 15787 / PB90-1) TaxID=452637 RepID=B1ZME1_OPITP|nr:DNA gyrase/topoisomerase IV subunit A [Opitutus terrae]ACB73394.1 DNA topoisomerase (ATP-hydrolyzing) [Opitutus terrae PB90-1]
MAKRKNAKNDNQSELPLGGASTPPKSPVSTPAAVTPERETNGNGASAEVPPLRRSGKKAQEEEAPLAVNYRNWFLDYASYVILDRAVPHIDDGLKPVQRRILHTMWEMEDGRFHKLANIVGATMRFHPHGDASIGAALVGLGQRGFLVEPQGNFGNLLTGDDAAAPRYIEARLTAFAKDVLFNPKTTPWQLSYDGRAREPVTLPAKFPIVLLEGAEGIAVGLATKILPHNFNDLCRAAINHLQGKTFRIYPDFPTGGVADFSEYNDGERGGKVKIRAKIEIRSKYLLAITELPFGSTTESLIESILAANAKGKIKIRHVDDNTADAVEILVHLPQGSDPEKLIQQLYVFTACQTNLSPAACVIEDDKPHFLGVREILKRSVDKTKALLKRELEIRQAELEQQWHWDSLERIFIEERIYRRIEKSKTWQSVLDEIREGLQPFLKQLRRPVTDDDITRLTEIRIKRISAYNRFQADEAIKKIEAELRETKANLKALTAYAVAWFEQLQEKYGKGLKRRTSYDEIEQINAAEVVSANQRLYVNREDGFIGLNWRQHEYVQDCTILDSVVCLMRDGSLKVSKVAEKVFMGRDIIHCAVFPKDGDPNFYTMVYQDKESGKAFAKRFQIGGLSRDKLYSLVKSEGSRVVYLEISKTEKEMPKKLRIFIDGRSGARVREFDFELDRVPVSSRSAKGLTVTKWPVKDVKRADLALA